MPAVHKECYATSFLFSRDETRLFSTLLTNPRVNVCTYATRPSGVVPFCVARVRGGRLPRLGQIDQDASELRRNVHPSLTCLPRSALPHRCVGFGLCRVALLIWLLAMTVARDLHQHEHDQSPLTRTDVHMSLGADEHVGSRNTEASTSNGSHTHLSTTPSTDNADEFLARAQALGLRLSRTDYERTRAGVAAFLKAERLPPASPSTSSAETSTKRNVSNADVEHHRDVTPQLSRWLRTTSGQLSFFTAVVRPMHTQPTEEHRARVTLDEVGSAEEKRRRRIRRRRMLEKQMLLESGHEAQSRATSPPLSTAEPSSPIRLSRDNSVVAESHGLESPLSISTAHAPIHDEPSQLGSPPTSPDIKMLNRMARVDPAGKLWLAPSSSIQDDVHGLSSETSFTPGLDEHTPGMDEGDNTSSDALNGWGPRPFTRASSGATDQLNACMKSMSLLDRIMMSKTSPRRMRREAKARERSRNEDADVADSSTISFVPSQDNAMPDTSMSSWADISSDYTTDPEKLSVSGSGESSTPETKTTQILTQSLSSTPAPAHRRSHSRHTSLSSLRRVHAVSTPLQEHQRPSDDISPDILPFTTLTPTSRFDPNTQITPMRYSPSMGVDYSYSRSTFAFSPNLITPWTHQGRLMSNAGLSNVPSSPFVAGEWASGHHMASSTGTIRGGVSNFAFSSTPLSHLPPNDPDLSAPFISSPSRLQCIESFPGRSPQGRDMDMSPTKRPLVTSPLANKSQSKPTSYSTMDRPSPVSTLMPSTTPSFSPVWRQISSLESRTPQRRTDTISPADIFGVSATQAHLSASASGVSPHAESAELPDAMPPVSSFNTPIPAPRQLVESPKSTDDDSEHPSAPSATVSMTNNSSPESRSWQQNSSRSRSSRRKNGVSRNPSTALAKTPAYGDDVFAKESFSMSPTKPAFKDVCNEMMASSDSGQTEWDQPDGSRIVKLVSEELQAALNSGTLDHEPEPRYFRLPPGHGSSKSKPSSVSYAGLIGQAILASSDGRLSLAEIYSWISSVYPYYERGDRGWQNSIRHNLSLNKSFVKLERESSIPGKGGWWAIQPGHESRFQNGLYLPNGGRIDAPISRPIRSASVAPSNPFSDDRARRKRTPLTPSQTNTASHRNSDTKDTMHPSSAKRTKTLRPIKFMQVHPSPLVQPPTSDGISSPSILASPSHDSKTDMDSFDTSTSRSVLATPGNGANAAPISAMTNAYRMSPSMQVRDSPSSARALLEGSNAPSNDLYPSAYPNMADYGSGGMMYLNRDIPYHDYGIQMTSSPHKHIAMHSSVMPQTSHQVACIPVHNMPMPFPHLQAHVPLVPAEYTRFTTEQNASVSWPDPMRVSGYKQDAPW